jgi:hypothetical protein
MTPLSPDFVLRLGVAWYAVFCATDLEPFFASQSVDNIVTA